MIPTTRLLLGCLALPLLISCASRSPVSSIQEPHVFDDQGAHLVTHSAGTCTACDLYHKVQGFIVLLDSAFSTHAGVVFTSEGTVVTSAQVSGKGPSVEVTSRKLESWVGTVAAHNLDLDLAIVTLPQPNKLWAPPDLHAGPPPPVGTEVFLIAYPVGLGWCVMHGIITGNRRVNGVSMIETNAVFLPGSAGGALVDGNGRLIGVVSSMRGKQGARETALVRPTAAALAYLEQLEAGAL